MSLRKNVSRSECLHCDVVLQAFYEELQYLLGRHPYIYTMRTDIVSVLLPPSDLCFRATSLGPPRRPRRYAFRVARSFPPSFLLLFFQQEDHVRAFPIIFQVTLKSYASSMRKKSSLLRKLRNTGDGLVLERIKRLSRRLPCRI